MKKQEGNEPLLSLEDRFQFENAQFLKLVIPEIYLYVFARFIYVRPQSLI